ncbi:LD-carboxypeptidase [Mucisphaera sp.]|uniref:LD-carboxypeptidase n=1 Tax=Mucisphaera sp. TaxID=2913024 RepID=UPI003D10932A
MTQTPKTRVAIIAPSSVVPQVELELGLNRIREAGFSLTVADQVSQTWYLHAGTDGARAEAIYDAARNPDIDILWCARGGYGAAKLLPLLKEKSDKHGVPPRKLLIGYSDITALHAFVADHWNYHTLHANMPASLSFNTMTPAEFDTTIAWAKGQAHPCAWDGLQLRWLTDAPSQPISGPVVGGNVSVWNSIYGTPWEPKSIAGKILFFEDLNEHHYRLDAMVTQIIQAGGYDNLAAIVLGDFSNGKDEAGSCLQTPPEPSELLALAEQGVSHLPPERIKPLRPNVTQDEALEHLLVAPARDRGIPVAAGLPVGHGPGFAPLPLGATFQLTPQGEFNLTHWDWLDT